MNAAAYVEKVTAFITRTGPRGMELLLFRHPSAGIQIPAGTVEEHEPVEQAVLREVLEETGLSAVEIIQRIGERLELPPGATNIIGQTTGVFARPNPHSPHWASFRRGLAVRELRRKHGFVQVTYEEGDQYPDPNYLSYVITGWVPEEVLALANRRHFYHLALTGTAAEHWEQSADQHIFRLFWAALADLPEIVAPQRAWLDYTTQSLGYHFE